MARPWEVLLPAGGAGNAVESIIMSQQIRMISAIRAWRMVGRLTDPALRREVAGKALLHLGLEVLDLVGEEPFVTAPSRRAGRLGARRQCSIVTAGACIARWDPWVHQL